MAINILLAFCAMIFFVGTIGEKDIKGKVILCIAYALTMALLVLANVL